MANGRNGKKIPRATIYKHFLSFPEEPRVRLLQRYLNPDTVFDLGASAYKSALETMKAMPREKAMAWLNDPSNLGASRKDLIARGERLSGSFLHDIYLKFAPFDPTDADKVYALFMSATLSNRLAAFFQDVKGKSKEKYQNKGLADLNNIQKISFFLEDPEKIAQGKSLDGFLEEVTKTMDLSKVNSATEDIEQALAPADPNRKEKLRQAAQVLLVQPQGKTDPGELGEKLAGDHWESAVKPRKAMEREKDTLPIDKLIARTKANIQDLAETPEQKLLFTEAALQNCREARIVYRDNDFEGEKEKSFARFTNELQEDIAKHYLTQSKSKELCSNLSEVYRTLIKPKSGFMLTTTNSPEHKTMTKNLRLFNAKLALLQGQKIDDLTLDPEEEKTVRESDLSTLYHNARTGCYNYGCLKTKNGRSSIIHDAGGTRFNSSIEALKQLNELGRQLRLGDPATLLRDSVQTQMLENRRDARWLTEHAADMAAKAIYAQTLLNEGKSWDQQNRLLSGEALLDKVEQIKNQPSFKQMVKSAGAKGLADAMIKGVSHLADLYGQAVRKTASKGEQPEPKEISPATLKVPADSAGLTSPQ